QLASAEPQEDAVTDPGPPLRADDRRERATDLDADATTHPHTGLELDVDLGLLEPGRPPDPGHQHPPAQVAARPEQATEPHRTSTRWRIEPRNMVTTSPASSTNTIGRSRSCSARVRPNGATRRLTFAPRSTSRTRRSSQDHLTSPAP